MGAPQLLIATGTEILQVDPASGRIHRGEGLAGRRPSCVALDPHRPGRAWAGTTDDGVLRSEDGGGSWVPSGLEGRAIMSIAASPSTPDLLWAGCEPSALFVSRDGGGEWHATAELTELPSSPEWAFPPKPETHHVRWIGCHPTDPDRLWLAIEAGALVRSFDGGGSWLDRKEDGPRDTHELAVHPERPEFLRVAAGDGYFESPDGGERWLRPREGFDIGYLRSVAIDPGDPQVIVVSGASRPRSTYVAGRSDGRVYRREGDGPWVRVRAGWPDPPSTIAPLLRAGAEPGELWAADERGVHRSDDGGRGWSCVAPFPTAPSNLRGVSVG
jgi:photosystem II stability/assembly factor-like uncharacterized protein